ncbi:MAG TPA: orotate phosphoribosyltransferase [Abditibacteriaceae bacterium]
MDSSQIEAVFRDSGALLDGHFLLASGRHSAQYIEKFRILEQPRLASALCGELASRFEERGISCVVGPVTGGIILAFEVARHLGCRAVYAERAENGDGFELRRGFQIAPGERVLVVEDIVTTGGSAQKVIETIRAAGGEVVGVGLLCDRSNGTLNFDVPIVESLLTLSIESFAPDEVPAWLEEKHGPAIKPGSTAKPGTRKRK